MGGNETNVDAERKNETTNARENKDVEERGCKRVSDERI